MPLAVLGSEGDEVMGMFDYVDFECPCPACGATLDEFQSKSGPCDMATLKPWQVTNFYTTCSACDKWVEFYSEAVRVAPWRVAVEGEIYNAARGLPWAPYVPTSEED